MKEILFSYIWRYMTSMGFILLGKSDPPPAPDYTAAANATAAGNLEAAKYATNANRVNQYTPDGNLIYSQNPTGTLNQSAYNTAMQNYQQQLSAYNNQQSNSSNGMFGGQGTYATVMGMVNGGSGSKGTAPIAPNQADYMTGDNGGGWSVTQTLSPAQQAIKDQQNQLNLGLQTTANKGLNYANDVLAQPGVDRSTLPQVGINPGQSYQDAMMSRLQPQIDRENSQSDAQLANQGIMQGSEAYKNAKTALSQQHNDLLNNATVQGFNTGLAANQNDFQQQSYNQMQPINVINALRTGSQVQGPQFTNVPQQATTAGADLLGAANSQYQNQLAATNASNASSGGLFGGLAQLGGTLGSAYMTGSDVNIKQNIKKLYKRIDGLNVYEFEYKPQYQPTWGDGKHIGVMAQQVRDLYPNAVKEHKDGYLMVDYAQL